MAWNKPSEAPKVAPKKPGALKGALAGVVVVAAIAAVFLFIFSGDEHQAPSAKHHAPGTIKETTPAAAPKPAAVETNAAPADAEAKLKPGQKLAEPKERKQVRGTEARIEREKAMGKRAIFRYDSEAYLGMYAQPGEPVPPTPFPKSMMDELPAALATPIKINEDDTEYEREMKEIVQGMKQELKAYLKEGGTVEGYLKELQERQDRESAYRAEAQSLVNKACEEGSVEDAYALWKKYNQHLTEQGIQPIPKNTALRKAFGRNNTDYIEPTTDEQTTKEESK